jgi:Glutathione S-transferase, N-terminal domain
VALAVKLHRCPNQWVKIKAHPCWKVERALMDMGIDYERVPGPLSRGKRTELLEATGQKKYPAIQFEDGTWYREDSKDMERTIREGHLMEKDTGGRAAQGGAEPA